MKLGITFGALAPKIVEQLKEQKFTAARIAITRAQNDADAVARLSVRGMLSDGETRNARRRILKRLLVNTKPLKANAVMSRRPQD